MKLTFMPGRKEFESFLDLQLSLVGLAAVDIAPALGSAYDRTAQIFSRIRLKNYNEAGSPVLRVAHNAQYTIFLYELSRMVFKAGNAEHADRIYALLRMVSSVDLFYEVEFPKLWGCDHPLGSVIGRGKFGPEATLFFSQNCTIGNNRGVFPKIIGNLIMAGNSSVLGDTTITGNVYMANGACAIDAGVLTDSFVFGRSPDLTLKPLSAEDFQKLTVLNG